MNLPLEIRKKLKNTFVVYQVFYPESVFFFFFQFDHKLPSEESLRREKRRGHHLNVFKGLELKMEKRGLHTSLGLGIRTFMPKDMTIGLGV